MYEVGDLIVYGRTGICEVTEITTLKMDGVPKDKLYYILRPVHEKHGKVFTPVDNEKIVMRRVISKEEAEKLIREIPQIEGLWIGNEKPGVDLSALRAMPNVQFLGVKPNAELPKYLAQFDVCLNLFDAGPLSKDVSPLKFYEYLATGKPIVSTRQPDQVLQFSDIIHIADNAKSFEQACAAALEDTQPERTNARIEAGRNSSWDARVSEICAVLREKGIL